MVAETKNSAVLRGKFKCVLLKAIKEERLSARMQLEVLNRLAGKGMLMSLQERRRLHRHSASYTVAF